MLKVTFKYPHKMTYWKYTEGSFTVQEEQDVLVLGYDTSRHLKDQINFKEFKFLSIMRDHDEQSLDSLFGLGLVPKIKHEEHQPNIIDRVHDAGYISNKMASIYLRNYDATVQENENQEPEADDPLPGSYLRFGEYDPKGIVQDNNMYFWSVTSKHNWTLDFYGV